MFYNELVRTPHAKIVEQQLEAEFNRIVPHPQAASPQLQKSYKDTQALVTTAYSTKASYEDLRNYYDRELTKNGWTFVSEGPTMNLGKSDPAGRMAHYCKGTWSA